MARREERSSKQLKKPKPAKRLENQPNEDIFYTKADSLNKETNGKYSDRRKSKSMKLHENGEVYPKPPEPIFSNRSRQIKLYHGDAFQLLSMCKDHIFDMIFADPPYFLSNDGITCQSGRMVSVNKGSWDKANSFEEVHEFNMKWLRECQRILKPTGTLWVSGTFHNIFSIGFALQELGYKILNDIIWYKVIPPPNLSCRYFVHSTETILWARPTQKGRHVFNYQEMKRIGDPRPGKQMQNLWHIPPPNAWEKRYGKHPTQKPEALLDRIVRACTKQGAFVLDPFIGSGTTAVICERLNRKCVGFDIDEKNLSIAIRRLKDEESKNKLAI